MTCCSAELSTRSLSYNPTNSLVIEVSSAIWPSDWARRVSSTSGNNGFARYFLAASNVCLSPYNSFFRTMMAQHLRESTFSKAIVFVCRSNFMNLCARLVSQLVTVSYTLVRPTAGKPPRSLLEVSAIKTIVRLKSINNGFCFADCKYIRSRCLAFTCTIGHFSHTSAFITV